MEKAMKYVAIFFLFLFIFSITFTKGNDFSQDLGRHLKLGEMIVAQKEIPKVNLFSLYVIFKAKKKTDHIYSSHYYAVVGQLACIVCIWFIFASGVLYPAGFPIKKHFYSSSCSFICSSLYKSKRYFWSALSIYYFQQLWL